MKSRRRCVKGVNLWRGCDEELKMCSSLCAFKRVFKTKVVNNYKTRVHEKHLQPFVLDVLLIKCKQGR